MQERITLEACVAACLLIENGRNALHVDIDPIDIEYPAARAVIGCAKEVGVVDAVLAAKWLKAQGLTVKVSKITEMLVSVPTSKHFMVYVQQLKACIYNAKISELRLKAGTSIKKGQDVLEIAKELQETEAALSAKYLEKKAASSLIEESADLINRIEKGADSPDMCPTGVKFFDEMFAGGLLPNELVIVAARPGVGKTAFALQLALDCHKPVVFFSLEMSKAQISPRLLSAIALRNTKIANRKPSQISAEIKRDLLEAGFDLMAASERIKVVDNPDQTIESIRREARREVEAGAKFVIIDYLQLLHKQAESRERAIAEISRGLKNMSKELSVPVICLAQMNRSIESEKRLPRLSDLRESGAIEQDANAVLFIHKKEDLADGKKSVVMLLAKGRDVGESYRRAVFNSDHQRFYAVAE